jgi:endonuclease/exonuclease/phosphatase family metal-dependent hydrolase
MPRFAAVALAVLLAGPLSSASADEFRILAWNVESNRPGAEQVSDPGVISEQLAGMLSAQATRAQIVALSEVEPKTMPIYKQAVQMGLDTEVDFVTSASGGFRDSDSLLLVVDAKRFAIQDVFELHRYAGIRANFNNMENDSADYGAVRARSPLVAKLRDKTTGATFWLIVNHLARGENDLRTEQAKALKKWAEDHPNEPVIAAGDFNFDYDFKTQKGNSAYDAMIEGGVWQWLKPDPLVDSNWADDRNNPGHDKYPDSILDFVFVANQAKNWKGESDVVVREGDFPDTDRTSDHRPIIATFTPPR